MSALIGLAALVGGAFFLKGRNTEKEPEVPTNAGLE